MASTIQKAACNRRPFVSEDGCDRGSVDIHQFDDFPFCDSASPTEPKVPPEIIDTPIVLPIPSPCACFNINHSFKFKYNTQRKFKAKASFAAKGDCCEGEYGAEFDLQIPCPIVGKTAVRKIKLKIDYGDSGKSALESYIKTDKDSCTIEPKDVNLNVNLPCPLPKNADKGILKFKIGYGDKGSRDIQSFARTERDSCTIAPKDMDFDLKIPCPIRESGTKKLKIGISYGSKQEATASFVKTSKDSCEIEVKNMDMTLQLPCPIKKNDKKVTIGIDWGSGNKKEAKKIIEADSINCKIEALEESFDLQIPCPVIGNAGDKKIKASIKYGNGRSSTSAIYLKTNTDNCTIEGQDNVALNLNLPCPIKGTEKKPKIKAQVKYGNSTGQKSAEFIEQDKDNCTINGKDASLDLQIKCPVIGNAGDKKIKASIKYGSGHSFTSAIYLKTNTESCNIEVQDEVALNLQIPCPVSKTKLVFSTSFANTDDSNGSFYIAQDMVDGCSRSIKFKVKFPGSVKAQIDAKVLYDIQYNTVEHKLQVKYIDLKTGEKDSSWTDVFTAVPHTGSC